jgi:hypothetical protein
MSSKFSSPFFQKSPLYGAYSSGAGGMVTVSYNDVHQKFQNSIAENVAKAYAPKNTPCDNLVQKLSDNKISNAAYETLSKKCVEQNNKDEDSNTGSFENVTGDLPFENKMGLSNYKKSNKTNPYYYGKGYESITKKVNLPELPDLG